MARSIRSSVATAGDTTLVSYRAIAACDVPARRANSACVNPAVSIRCTPPHLPGGQIRSVRPGRDRSWGWSAGEGGVVGEGDGDGVVGEEFGVAVVAVDEVVVERAEQDQIVE